MAKTEVDSPPGEKELVISSFIYGTRCRADLHSFNSDDGVPLSVQLWPGVVRTLFGRKFLSCSWFCSQLISGTDVLFATSVAIDLHLCRDTPYDTIKRSKVISGNLKFSFIFVLCLFSSFHKPGAQSNFPGGPNMWVSTQLIIWNRIQVAQLSCRSGSTP